MASSPTIKLPPSAAQFSPLSIARMIWLHKFTILAVWLVVSAIVAAVVYTLPAQYSAEVQILVYPQNIPERLVQSIVSTNIQDRLLTISAQILSAPQLQKIIDDFGLYKKERKDHIPEEILRMMRSAINVKLDKGWTNNQPGAFRISYTGDDPATVAQVTNRLANLFIEENMRFREVQVEGSAEFLDTLLADARKKLDDSDAAIAAYKQKHNGELPEQVAAISGNLGRLQSEQTANRDAIARAQQAKVTYQDTLEVANASLQALLDRYNGTRNGAPAQPGQDDFSPGATAAVTPAKIIKPSDALQSQLETLQAKGYGEAHPEVKRLRYAIAQAKEEEAKAQQDAAANPAPAPSTPAPKRATAAAVAAPAPETPADQRPDVIQARERVRAITSQIDLADKEVATRTADQDRLANAVSEAQARYTNVPVREQEIAEIMRDHSSYQADYQALLGKVSAAKISSDMELRQKSERFAINDPARVPGKPVSPDRPVLDFMGSLSGLGLGFVIAFLSEFHKGRLLGAWELPDDALVLAHVPIISFSADQKRSIWSNWSRGRRMAVVSSVLVPLLALVVAARIYLMH